MHVDDNLCAAHHKHPIDLNVCKSHANTQIAHLIGDYTQNSVSHMICLKMNNNWEIMCLTDEMDVCMWNPLVCVSNTQVWLEKQLKHLLDEQMPIKYTTTHRIEDNTWIACLMVCNAQTNRMSVSEITCNRTERWNWMIKHNDNTN